MKITGRVRLQLIREDGSEEVREVDNLLVNLGKNHIAYKLSNLNVVGPQEYLAVGTNPQAPNVNDSSLGAEVARVHMSSVSAQGPNWTIYGVFPPGVGTGALVEAGIFDTGNPAATTIMCRSTFAVVNKQAGDTLNIVWTVAIG